jgi:hypothetical protein
MLRSITAFDKSFATEMSFRLAPFDIQRLILGRGSSTFAVSFRSEFPVSLKYKNPFSVFCNECKNETTPAPILIASEWDKIAGNKFLCAGCLEDRGVSKGNPITLPSLAPCTYNLIFPNYTDSWFSTYASDETTLPPNIEEWRSSRKLALPGTIRTHDWLYGPNEDLGAHEKILYLNCRPQYLLEKFEEGYRVRPSTQEDLDCEREDCRCADCSGITAPSPMLQDREWARLADEREYLCVACLINRAEAKGVRLSLASLKPCPLNLLTPSSLPYYYIFASVETRPPQNIDEWSDAYEEAQKWLDLYEPVIDAGLKQQPCYKWLQPIPPPSTLEEFFKDAQLPNGATE